MWRRYLGEVGKFLPYFVANLSKTLHINFYQNRSSIVEVIVGFGWLVDDVWACAIAELVMGVDIWLATKL